MFKILLVLSVIAFACAAPGVVVAPAVPIAPIHTGAHAVHSHVIHHPVPVKTVVTPVVAKHVVPIVPVVKPVVPVVPVHHAHPAVVVHH
ncbi:uncharacterized protein LOC105665235 [Ceratitis capitata]|uniref:(Mediterranean fruit fly) hypothetical protein n=1 Tax=Ceratitis capitata TaxID=7213 RepID=A0A811U7T6_CERCA|nr:uncharacterized protein LOC105665235 [Ceratitis capitata]CAD6994027.1 unnamed protein product [Ceratitis capitata]